MKFEKDVFKLVRESKQKTLSDVGKAIGLSKQTISKWESGAVTPRPSNLYAAANYLGISVVDISDLKPEKWLATKKDEIIPNDGFFDIVLKAWEKLSIEQKSKVAALAAELKQKNEKDSPPSTGSKMA